MIGIRGEGKGWEECFGLAWLGIAFALHRSLVPGRVLRASGTGEYLCATLQTSLRDC